ncbi:GntR family transcriptional regulator [Pararhodobacter sp.]|jgi:DNA-binding GntR family transcriptional regulator|uniref:GntR family transcriptional regulator n=1 Tax=Pararhodobacter sp. TaxID=2127056 RepID=UPI002FDD6DFC
MQSTDTHALLAKLPEHEATYRRLRDMVLFGVMAPGQKVTIQGITRSLDAGMTPVREAIRRLTAEGALELHENRRVSVPRLTPSQLDEISFARLAVEPRLAMAAMARMRPQDIEALARIDGEIDAAIERMDVHGYLAGNFRFHFAIYEIAAAPILLSLTQSLWLRFGPSLRVVIESEASIGPDRHRDAMAAMRAQDARALSEAIEADIAQGMERVRTELENAASGGAEEGGAEKI